MCLKEFNSFSYTTQRIELFYEHDSKIFSEKKLWLKESKLFSMTLELNFFQQTTQSTDFSKIWLTELQLFEIMTHRIEFLSVTQRIEPFWKYYSQNWTFFSWLKRIELFFFEYDSKNWTFFWFNSKNWTLFYLSK